MKSLAKGVLVLVLGGTGATLLAQPSGVSAGSEAASVQAQMRSDHQAVLKMKAAAQREKDIIKVNCVNDKLVQMLPQMNMVDSLIAKLSAGTDQATLMVDIQAGAQKVAEQREAAAQCVDSKSIVGESSTTFAMEGDIDDPWEDVPDFGEDVVIEPPGFASPDQ